MVFVSAFACGTLFLASDRFLVVPCHVTDHICFALLRSRWWWPAVRRVVVVEFGTQMHSQVSHSLRVQSRNYVSWCLRVHAQGDYFPVFLVSLVEILSLSKSGCVGLREVRPSSLANRCAGPDGFFLDAHKP